MYGLALVKRPRLCNYLTEDLLIGVAWKSMGLAHWKSMGLALCLSMGLAHGIGMGLAHVITLLLLYSAWKRARPVNSLAYGWAEERRPRVILKD